MDPSQHFLGLRLNTYIAAAPGNGAWSGPCYACWRLSALRPLAWSLVAGRWVP